MSIPTTHYSGNNPMTEQVSFLPHPVTPHFSNSKPIIVAYANLFKKNKVFQTLTSIV